MKRLNIFIILLFNIAIVNAEQISGTPVNITPPTGFETSERFSGFMNKAITSSIAVSEVAAPYAGMITGFNDTKLVKAKGLRAISNHPVTVDNHVGMLLHFEQDAFGISFKKWVLALDYDDKTLLIVASYRTENVDQEEVLKNTILAATLGEATSPIEALTFTAKPSHPFHVAKVFEQNLILSPDGQFPLNNENTPFMVLGLSMTERVDIPDRRVFSEHRMLNTATVENINVKKITPITVDGLSGYATVAEGDGAGSATPMTIYQVMLFDGAGYSLIQGITPTSKKDTYLPIFEETAMTFEMK